MDPGLPCPCPSPIFPSNLERIEQNHGQLTSKIMEKKEGQQRPSKSKKYFHVEKLDENSEIQVGGEVSMFADLFALLMLIFEEQKQHKKHEQSVALLSNSRILARSAIWTWKMGATNSMSMSKKHLPFGLGHGHGIRDPPNIPFWELYL